MYHLWAAFMFMLAINVISVCQVDVFGCICGRSARKYSHHYSIGLISVGIFMHMEIFPLAFPSCHFDFCQITIGRNKKSEFFKPFFFAELNECGTIATGCFLRKEFVFEVFRDLEYFNSKFQLLWKIVCLQLLYSLTLPTYLTLLLVSALRFNRCTKLWHIFAELNSEFGDCDPFLHAIIINLHCEIEREREIST